MEILFRHLDFARHGKLVLQQGESQDARGTAVRIDQSRTCREDRRCVCSTQSNWVRSTRASNLDRAPSPRRRRKPGSRTRPRADARRANSAIRPSRLRRLRGMRLARPDAQATCYDRPWIDRGAVSGAVEHPPRASNDCAGLFGAPIRLGETDRPWAGARTGAQGFPRRTGAGRARARTFGRIGTGISATRKTPVGDKGLARPAKRYRAF